MQELHATKSGGLRFWSLSSRVKHIGVVWLQRHDCSMPIALQLFDIPYSLKTRRRFHSCCKRA